MADPIREGDSLLLRKERGAFFTPEPLARFLARCVVERGATSVLDPACGEAVFLIAAGEESRAAGHQIDLHGVEIFPSSAEWARTLVDGYGLTAEIRTADFFGMRGQPMVDAVLGNPPYVRYQQHTGAARAASREAAARSGVELGELASVWAAFTVHSTAFLNTGGTLALVLPAELLSVNYAAPVRRFLSNSFREVDLYLFDELVFPGAQEEVVLLVASGFSEGPSASLRLHQGRNAESLRAEELGSLRSTRWIPEDAADKWTGSLLPNDARQEYADVRAHGDVCTLVDWGAPHLGAVTGANSFFTLNEEDIDRFELVDSDVVAISPPGSRHLRALVLDRSGWESLRAGGSRTYLFRPDGDPSAGARQLIAEGERAGVDQAYKCRVRNPWWRVPLPRRADLFLTYMNADTPRLATNGADLAHLNSVHGVTLVPEHRELGRELLPLASMNTATRLSAEIVGRAYGGGLLKIEPREASRLLMPSPALVLRVGDRLRALLPDARHLLAVGRGDEVIDAVDRIVVEEGLGIDSRRLRAARDDLHARRAARGTPAGKHPVKKRDS